MNEMREKILSVIEKNSRITIHDLAVVLGEKEDDVASAIFEMEREKTICGYHTIINWNKTAKEKVVAVIEVRVTPQRGRGFDRIAERIYNFPEVDSVYLMSGTYDFMVMLEGKTLQEVAYFVSDKLSILESVMSTATHFVLKKYKDHGTIIIPAKNEDERQLITP